MDNLPDCLIIEILSRLNDTTELTRCKCLSKSLNRLAGQVRSIHLYCNRFTKMRSPDARSTVIPFKAIFHKLISDAQVPIESVSLGIDESLDSYDCEFEEECDDSFLTAGPFCVEWLTKIGNGLKSISISPWSEHSDPKETNILYVISHNSKAYLRDQSNGNSINFQKARTSLVRAEATVATPTRKFAKRLTELSVQSIPHSDLHINEIVKRQTMKSFSYNSCEKPNFDPAFLEEGYELCKNICSEYAKTFYLGTSLMTKERQKAIWAIYVWCRRTDELVDGPNAEYMSSSVLDRWEERLYDIFNGRPFDMFDAALSDTVHNFPLDIKPFGDMIEGMRMDTRKSRYKNFQEIYLYCYYVAGTVALMTVPVMGIPPDSTVPVQSIYDAALYLGIGNQLTNILRDVGEDTLRGRIYLPQDELEQFGISEEEVFSRKVSDKWREFMKMQITRARYYFNQAEQGASQLDKDSRWPVWSSLMLYREILDAIEDNDYDNLTKRAYVGRTKKLLMLPLAYTRSLSTSNLALH